MGGLVQFTEFGGVEVVTGFVGEELELGDFGLGEDEAAGFFGGEGGVVFDLAGEHGAAGGGGVAVAEDVFEDGLDVGGLVAVVGEDAGAEGVGVDDLEEEVGGGRFTG